MKAY
jgi:hypothetical protein